MNKDKDNLTFDPREYFQGKLKAWGIIQSRGKKILSRFDAEMEGNWEGSTCTLDESYVFHGTDKKLERTWKITELGKNKYEATASDIVGRASGSCQGSAMRWDYVLVLPYGNSKVQLATEDWMWAMGNGSVINRSYMRKLGIIVAELTAFMQKE